VQTAHPARVISAAVLPRTKVVNAVLVASFALLTALAAQISIPLPFTPVPITAQTFAVLVSGAALGSGLGAASQALYFMMGAVGLPFYAEASGGWEAATGATGGYLVGFIVAAWVVGFLAERKQDRNVWSAIPAFLTGNAVIYLFGVPWLLYSVSAFTTWEDALVAGFLPFIVGDIVKVAVAGLSLPLAWRAVGDARR
jgi:biotin transport system substrate-specific component